MKNFTIVISLVLFSLNGFAQTHGISYQAIIIDKETRELPGIDVEGSYLPNKELVVRFSILNETGGLDYQETHATQTDAYGMINLLIGQGVVTGESTSDFISIDWDGTPKDLRVEISIGAATDAFEELSQQPLTFVPYAFHRNITATGNLTVDGQSTFNGEVEFQDITVQGLTNLNGGLNVNNGTETNLSGNLNTEGATTLQGNLLVQQMTTLNNTLTVNSTTGLNGQVTINADVNGADNSYSSYPLRVQGSNQGIAIRVDGNRSNSNNFVTFWDQQGIQGRIEGQTTNEVFTSPEYIFDHAIFALKTVAQVANLATALAAAVVDPGNAIIEGVNSVTLAAEIVEYEIFAFSNVGVTYESGSGDYAEWLPRLDPNEKIDFGQVVGVFGGKITKRTRGAERMMVVSHTPIVLGNMPPANEIEQYEKIGFMGQVPVWVYGQVSHGDYILPSGSGNGVAIARHPTEMLINDYSRIVGIAWSDNPSGGLDLITVAIGINSNDVSRVVAAQQQQISELQSRINELEVQREYTQSALAELVPGFREAMERNEKSTRAGAPSTDRAQNTPTTVTKDQPHTPVVTRMHVERSLALFERRLTEAGVDVSTHPIFSRIHTDPEFKEEMIQKAMELVKQSQN